MTNKATVLIRFSAALAAATTLFGLAATAHAVDAGVEGNEVEEITVTARRREESLQEVPVTVTAFGATTLETAGVNKTDDFIQLTPNVTLAESSDIGISFLTIRGQTQTRRSEMPVAVVVDGVPLFNSNQFSSQVLDVQQIEIVKGPQGALYGRNATGGAILVTTRMPSADEFSGHAKVGFGRYNSVMLESSVNVPLGDALALRVAGRVSEQDGPFYNINRNEPLAPQAEKVLRGRMRWTPTDSFAADLIVNWSDSKGQGLGWLIHAGTTNLSDETEGDFVSNVRDSGGREAFGLSVNLEWDLGFATLASVTAYDDFDRFLSGDNFAYGPELDRTQHQYTEGSAFSQELRLTGNSDSRLRWQIGASFLDSEFFINASNGWDTGTGAFNTRDMGPQLDLCCNPTRNYNASDNDVDARAVFGQLNYDLLDNLEVSIAGRYDEEDRTQTNSAFNGLYHTTGGAFDPLAAYVPEEPGAVFEETYSKFQPKVTVNYAMRDGVRVFASWGVGYRAGQFNPTNALNLGIPGVVRSVDQEEAEQFEVGFKTESAEGRLRVNGSYFQTDLTNSQFAGFNFTINNNIFFAIDEVDVKGFELDATWSTTDDLQLYAAYGQTDAEIVRFTGDPSFEGNDAPFVPDYTLNLGFQWTPRITDRYGLITRMDFERRGPQYFHPQSFHARSAIDLLTVNVGLEPADGNWSLMGRVRNAQDTRYNAEVFPFPGLSTISIANRAVPRTWAVEFTYRF